MPYIPVKHINPIGQYNNPNIKRAFHNSGIGSLNSKIKAKYILHDKEQLYDESIKLKEEIHRLKTDNMQLKTKVQQYDKELNKKDKETEDILAQFQTNAQNPNRFARIKMESHMLTSLKKQVKDLRTSEKSKEEEISTLRKNIKVTKLQEMETEMKMYIDECTRLKHLLEDILQQKGLPGQEDINALEQKFNQQSNLLRMAKQENAELANEYKVIEAEIVKWKGIATELEKKSKTTGSKDLQSSKKLADAYKKECEKLRQELASAKGQNKSTLISKIEQPTTHNNNLTVKLE